MLMTVILIRSFVFYILLMLMMKLMGKRQIGEMQLSEFVTTVLLSELAVLPVTDTDIPIIHGVIPVLLISSTEVIIAFVSQKSKKFRVLLNGNPITLYENDGFINKNLIKARMSEEDVEAQVRINGFDNMSEVKQVILERTGKMSVLPKEASAPNQSGE